MFDSRRSTFHTFPQYLFPSHANDLPSHLETPYAYSHHQAAFYWTRQDAKSALIWNLLARPPCLNCVLLGERVAKRCDRMERQWRSQHVHCCKRCEIVGLGDACVEMVEIRVLPQFDPLLPNGTVLRPRFNKYGVDIFLWTDAERAVRKQGRAVWRPLNLGTGDVRTKAKLAANFASGRTREITLFSIDPQIWHREDFGSDMEAWFAARRMMGRKVNRWDQADADLISRKSKPESEWATTLFDATNRLRSRPARRNLERQVMQLDGTESNQENQQRRHQAQLIKDIGAQRRVWELTFRQARQKLHERNVIDHGIFEAHRIDDHRREDAVQVMKGIRDFFDQKQFVLGYERDEHYACWESARMLDRVTRDLIEDFIPGMFLPEEA